MADGLGIAIVEVIDNQINIPPPYSFLDCKKQLMFDFKKIYARDIDNILKFHSGHYAQAYNSLTLVMNEIRNKFPEFGNEQQASKCNDVRLTLKDGKRRSRTVSIQGMVKVRICPKEFIIPEDLRQEVARTKEQLKNLDEEASRRLALNLLEEDYLKMGQLIECVCCFGNCVFDNMAQCMEGHLVCVECLNAFTKEIVFGAGKVTHRCMVLDCPAEYPQSELKRCLTSKTWSKLEERTLMESLCMAKIENLVRCPYCDFAAILPTGEKMFLCHRGSCQKTTCRDCGADWDGHEGLPCSMVESRGETSLRKEYEEKMTKAKVRTCASCNAQFTKESGCNKMACRCAVTMCYICRTPRINYEHFCRHAYDPSNPCTICTLCPLWTNNEQDDDRAIEEIRREARAKRKALGYGDRDIGAPTTMKRAKY